MTKCETEEEDFKVELALNEKDGRGGGGGAERRTPRWRQRRKTGWSRKVREERKSEEVSQRRV